MQRVRLSVRRPFIAMGSGVHPGRRALCRRALLLGMIGVGSLAQLGCGARSSLDVGELHSFDEPPTEDAVVHDDQQRPLPTVISPAPDPVQPPSDTAGTGTGTGMDRFVPPVNAPSATSVVPVPDSDPTPAGVTSSTATVPLDDAPSPLDLPTADWGSQWGTPIFDEVTAVAIAPSGDVVVAGTSSTGTDDPGREFRSHFVRKFTFDGELLWESTQPDGDAVALGPQLTLSDEGDVFLVSSAGSDASRIRGRVIALDAAGEHKWTTEWGDHKSLYIYATTTDVDGNVYAAGSIASRPRDLDYFVTKLDRDGEVLWTRDWGSPDTQEMIQALAVDSAAELTFTARIGYAVGALDSSIVRQDVDGNTLWSHSWTGEDDQTAPELAVDHDGNLFVGGTVVHEPASNAPGDSFVSKFTPDGQLLWTYVHDESLDDDLTALALDSRGRPAFATIGPKTTVVQLDADGQLQSTTLIAPAGSTDVTAIGFGPNDQLFVAGDTPPGSAVDGLGPSDVFMLALEPMP